MKNQITSRDYKQSSAYLDNQLAGKERAQLESRRKVDPECRKELQEISKTRVLLKSLPRLRAPRNYYISAQPVGVRSRLRLAPTFGIVSALATILLAVGIFSNKLLIPHNPR